MPFIIRKLNRIGKTMFKFLKRKQHQVTPPQTENLSSEEQHHLEENNSLIPQPPEVEHLITPETDPLNEQTNNSMSKRLEQAETESKGFFSRLKKSLTKTRKQLAENLASLILGRKTIDAELLSEIEEQLIIADIGISATEKIIQNLTQNVNRKEIKDPEALMVALRNSLEQLLLPCQQPLIIDQSKKPYVILVVGVNGAGKTTTIGKVCHHLQKKGLSILLAAGDTFRAAAIQQLQTWGERNQVTVVAQESGSDSASVIFDSIQAAKARGIDVVIADTAGRLHTQNNLMEELKKIKRVITKIDPEAPHETLLVIDAITGQNALNQALQFNQSLGLSGLALTKLDGTAKGGVIFAIADTLKLPIRFIGIGEGIDDLKPFQAKEFVEALFANHDDSI